MVNTYIGSNLDWTCIDDAIGITRVGFYRLVASKNKYGRLS